MADAAGMNRSFGIQDLWDSGPISKTLLIILGIMSTALVAGLAVPLLIFNAGGAWLASLLSQGNTAPGFRWVLLASTLASLVTMSFVAALSYYSTIGAWRLNVDPDSYGIPIVTASVDFVGTMALVVAVVGLGLI